MSSTDPPPDGTKRAVLFRLFGTVGLFNKLQTQKKTVVLRSRGGATQERHQGKFSPPPCVSCLLDNQQHLFVP